MILDICGVDKPIVKAHGINLDLDTLKLKPETLYLLRLLEKGNFSLNLGGNDSLLAGTIGYKTKYPVVIHAGITKPWEDLADLKKKPGVFAGFEFSF